MTDDNRRPTLTPGGTDTLESKEQPAADEREGAAELDGWLAGKSGSVVVPADALKLRPFTTPESLTPRSLTWVS